MKTDIYVVRLSDGERVGEAVKPLLDPVDMGSIGHFAVSKDQPTELHYHDYDEYWYFTEGTTTVTLRTSDGTSQVVSDWTGRSSCNPQRRGAWTYS